MCGELTNESRLVLVGKQCHLSQINHVLSILGSDTVPQGSICRNFFCINPKRREVTSILLINCINVSPIKRKDRFICKQSHQLFLYMGGGDYGCMHACAYGCTTMGERWREMKDNPHLNIKEILHT